MKALKPPAPKTGAGKQAAVNPAQSTPAEDWSAEASNLSAEVQMLRRQLQQGQTTSLRLTERQTSGHHAPSITTTAYILQVWRLLGRAHEKQKPAKLFPNSLVFPVRRVTSAADCPQTVRQTCSALVRELFAALKPVLKFSACFDCSSWLRKEQGLWLI